MTAVFRPDLGRPDLGRPDLGRPDLGRSHILWCGWDIAVLVCWSVGPVSELSEFDWRAEGLTSWGDWRIGVVGELEG